MRIHRITVGDLCRPFNMIRNYEILLVNSSLTKVLGRAHADDLLMVTADLPVTVDRRECLQDLDFGLGGLFKDKLDRVQLLEVLVSTGQHMGQAVYVPSFWLEPVVRAPR